MAVAGKAKSGKSFMWNHVLGISHEEGFPVEVSVHPGTKGIQLWGMPRNLTVHNETYQVVFIDTEGLGAIGGLRYVRVHN